MTPLPLPLTLGLIGLTLVLVHLTSDFSFCKDWGLLKTVSHVFDETLNFWGKMGDGFLAVKNSTVLPQDKLLYN